MSAHHHRKIEALSTIIDFTRSEHDLLAWLIKTDGPQVEIVAYLAAEPLDDETEAVCNTCLAIITLKDDWRNGRLSGMMLSDQEEQMSEVTDGPIIKLLFEAEARFRRFARIVLNHYRG